MSELTELTVCVDCYLYVATGETEPSWSEEELFEFRRDYDEAAQAFTLLVNGVAHHEGCTHDLESEDCPREEPHFSSQACQLCRSPLGGDRYIVAGRLVA